MTEERYFKLRELDGSSFFWEGGPVGVLLVHGFTATTVEVRGLGQALHASGCTVSGPLLPGHFTTLADLNRAKWQDWYAAVEQAYEQLKARCATMIVGGESMGSLLTLLLASRHSEIKVVLSFAPALVVKGLGLSLFLAPFVPVLHSSGEDDGLPWQGYTARPVRALTQLYRLQQVVRKALPAVRQPALILQGRHDQTIDPAGAVQVYNALGSTDKTFIWMEHSPHLILLAQEKEKAFALALDFIRRVT